MRTTHIRSRRSGLTIVEMLVACALAVFLMAVLSQAFVVGLTAFRHSKAIATMDQQLRQVSTLLRKDMALNHFEGDARLREIVPGQVGIGYFQIGEGFDSTTNLPGVREGGDAYSFGSVRDTDDWLAFTVRLNGNRADDFFYGTVPIGSPLDLGATAGYANSRWDSAVGTYSSQWAEVVYFLRPDPDPNAGMTEAPDGLTVTDPTTGNQVPMQRLQLFQLFRRQRLLVPDNFTTGTTMQPSPDLLVPPGTRHQQYDVGFYRLPNPAPGVERYRFTSPADIQFPVGLKQTAPGNPPNYQWDFGRRFQPITNPANPAAGVTPALLGFPRLGYIGDLPAGSTIPPGYDQRQGGDLILNNVLSFDVKVWDPQAQGGTGAWVDLGFGIPPAAMAGAWTPTPRTAASPRPLGNLPLNLGWTTGPLPAPTYHPSQRIYTNAWVYDTWTRRMGGGDINHTNGWNFKGTLGTSSVWSQQEPYPTSVQAIQITIRLWDRKTNQTRQVTLVQDM
jgi:hypothetical protein